MNKVILMGRLTRDPEVRYSNAAEPLAIVRYTLAVDRRVSRERRDSGEQTADFINCTAFGRAAEFVERYFRKGQLVSVVGRMQVRSYDDNTGQRRWATEVITDEHFFAESRASFESRGQGGGQNPNYNNNYGDNNFMPPDQGNYAPPQQQKPAGDSFFEVDTGPSLDDDDLPF
ncbi:MAG: single-stranded DNA-binding protein [Defluviitaleaceae bacterium]|nr:single-stranded DNA-binding protein [Defluviitaleaceae bacterium]